MSEKQNEEIGSLTGTLGGVLAGASLGTAVMPVVGTFAGALIGGIVGSQVGKTVGGAILNAFEQSTTPAAVHHPAAADEDLISKLERLSQLRAQGVITEEEFAAAKAKILGA